MLEDHLLSGPAKKILFGILNWGLGHATRSVPIIKDLISNGHQVTVASDGQAGLFIKQLFPQLDYIELPSYDIQYDHQKIEWSILNQGLKILAAIRAEKKTVKDLCNHEVYDNIISDSRFGFRHPNIHSTIITHQTKLISDNLIFAYFGNKINTNLIEGFDECWIPDDDKHSLSGLLSTAKLKISTRYIDSLSRFQFEEISQDIDLLVLISGPEPKRTYLEKIVLKTLSTINLNIHVVRGQVEDEQKVDQRGNLIIYNYLSGQKLNHLLNRSKLVLSRSGYSSIMDYDCLNKKAILVPTPGQTEQLYLAEHLSHYTNFTFLSEDKIESDLVSMLEILV